MFYFGMGAYLYTGGAQSTTEPKTVGPSKPIGPARHLPYSRFSPRSRTTAIIERSSDLSWQDKSQEGIHLDGNNRIAGK
jgi:hypothetical protein